jgi:hypothetical protein
VVVIRGTLYIEEWTANFRLQRADEDEVEKYGFEGIMVPKGFFGLFTEVLPQVGREGEEVERLFKHFPPHSTYISFVTFTILILRRPLSFPSSPHLRSMTPLCSTATAT